MATHSLPTDSTARRLRSLEIQNYLIKIAVVVLMLLLLWRTFTGNPAAPTPAVSPAEPSATEQPPAAEATSAAPGALTTPSIKSPAAVVSPRLPNQVAVETGTANKVATSTPIVSADLSRAQIDRTTQKLIEAVFLDPRYREAFQVAWTKRAGTAPSGKFVFPEPFIGEVIGPTQQADGFRDYQVWGDGLHDANAQRLGNVWYMVLWNFDPTNGRAYVESLQIGGKEIVHDWRPYSRERVSVQVE